ncbi:MAG: metallophosphoesterase family protein, partial [Spirochaetales bacterium]|nr:metallophosphoesterase family protein [Spirochaetales bacterium]
MKLYISDLHFFHESLLNNLDNRPFSSVEDMNEFMVAKWNEKVKSRDEVFVLGDLSFGNVEETTRILNRLKGKITLIAGNHDSFAKKSAFTSTR